MIISNNKFSCSNKSRIARIEGVRDFVFEGNSMKATGTAATVGYVADYGHLLILDSTNGNIAQGIISDTFIDAVDQSSTGIIFSTPCTGEIKIDNLKIPNCAHGIRASNASSRPYITVSNADIDSDLACISILNANTLKVTSSELKSSATSGTIGGINISDIQGQVTVYNTDIVGWHGILAEVVAAKARIKGCHIKTIATSTGLGIGVKSNAVVDSNEIEDFVTGVQFTNSDRVKYNNNVHINNTTDVVTTASTNTMTDINFTY